MLDYFCIFSKGGTLLWALSFVGSLKGDPVNALIRGCLLEERAGQAAYEYIVPSGGAYTLKWSLNNVGAGRGPGGERGRRSDICAAALGVCRIHAALPPLVPACLAGAPIDSLPPPRCPQGLGLVFVAVYQKALKLLYVDELLERANKAFAPRYRPGVFEYPDFDATFQVRNGESGELQRRPSSRRRQCHRCSANLGCQRAEGRSNTGKGEGAALDAICQDLTSPPPSLPRRPAAASGQGLRGEGRSSQAPQPAGAGARRPDRRASPRPCAFCQQQRQRGGQRGQCGWRRGGGACRRGGGVRRRCR